MCHHTIGKTKMVEGNISTRLTLKCRAERSIPVERNEIEVAQLPPPLFFSFRPFKPSTTTSNCQTCEQSGNVNFSTHPPKRNPADRVVVGTNLILLLTLGIFLSDVQPSPPHVIPGVKKKKKKSQSISLVDWLGAYCLTQLTPYLCLTHTLRVGEIPPPPYGKKNDPLFFL